MSINNWDDWLGIHTTQTGTGVITLQNNNGVAFDPYAPTPIQWEGHYRGKPMTGSETPQLDALTKRLEEYLKH